MKYIGYTPKALLSSALSKRFAKPDVSAVPSTAIISEIEYANVRYVVYCVYAVSYTHLDVYKRQTIQSLVMVFTLETVTIGRMVSRIDRMSVFNAVNDIKVVPDCYSIKD